MKQSSRKGSITGIREEAEQKKKETIAALKVLMKDKKYKKYKDAVIRYEKKVIDSIKNMGFTETSLYATQIAIACAELRILEQLHNTTESFVKREEKQKNGENDVK